MDGCRGYNINHENSDCQYNNHDFSDFVTIEQSGKSVFVHFVEVIPVDSVVERILVAMKAKGLDQKTFAARIEVSPQVITDWKKGNTNSYTRYITQIAETLDTTVGFLLTGEQKEKPTLPMESELDAELITRLCSLTPEELKQVDAFVKGLLAAR